MICRRKVKRDRWRGKRELNHLKFRRRIIIAVVLLASLASNAILLGKSADYYWRMNEFHLDPLGLEAYPPSASTPEKSNAPGLAVFFGDSRAYAWPPPARARFAFVNRGIGNQTSAQALGRFDLHVAPLHPRIIIVQVGVNDLKTIPLFRERKQKIVLACKQNIKQIVDKSNALGATVILTTIFPLGELPFDRRLFWSEDVALAINDVNDYLRSLANQNVIVFDTGEILADRNGMVRAEYAYDFLHLNPIGYRALNQKLASLLDETK